MKRTIYISVRKMTKITLILATWVLAIKASAAPSETITSARSEERLKIIPSLGYTYFTVEGTSADFKAKGGGSVSVLAQYPITTQFMAESGLEYLETGARMSVDLGFLSLDVARLKVSNLALPLRAKYIFNTPEEGGAHYYGKLGAALTYVIQGKMETPQEEKDVKSDLNAFGVLSQAGLGADWSVPYGRVSLDLSYNYGLTKVMKSIGGRSTGFQLVAGYIIEI